MVDVAHDGDDWRACDTPGVAGVGECADASGCALGGHTLRRGIGCFGGGLAGLEAERGGYLGGGVVVHDLVDAGEDADAD